MAFLKLASAEPTGSKAAHKLLVESCSAGKLRRSVARLATCCFSQIPLLPYLLDKPMGVELLVAVNKLKEVAH